MGVSTFINKYLWECPLGVVVPLMPPEAGSTSESISIRAHDKMPGYKIWFWSRQLMTTVQG